MTEQTPKRPRRATISFDDAQRGAPVKASEAAPAAESEDEQRTRRDADTFSSYNDMMEKENGPVLRMLRERGETVQIVSPDAPTSPNMDAKPTDDASPAKAKAAPPRASRPVAQETQAEDPAAERQPFLGKIFVPMDQIPSMGRSYPKGATIAYRPYMFGEVEEFDTSDTGIADKFLRVLQGIETKGMDRMELTFGDFFYLGILRKIVTMDAEEFGLDTACPTCKGINSTRMRTDEIDFTTIAAPKLPAKLTLNTVGRQEFEPLRIGDWFQIVELGLEPNRLTCTAATCHTMDFPESVEKFGTIMDPHDIALIQRLDQMFYHGPTPVPLVCSHSLPDSKGTSAPCGTAYSVRLENSAEAFLYPFRGEGRDLADEIDFG